MSENWTNLAESLKKIRFCRTRRTRFLELCLASDGHLANEAIPHWHSTLEQFHIPVWVLCVQSARQARRDQRGNGFLADTAQGCRGLWLGLRLSNQLLKPLSLGDFYA